MSSIRPTRVEVITGVQRRRHWSPEQKLEIVKLTSPFWVSTTQTASNPRFDNL